MCPCSASTLFRRSFVKPGQWLGKSTSRSNVCGSSNEKMMRWVQDVKAETIDFFESSRLQWRALQKKNQKMHELALCDYQDAQVQLQSLCALYENYISESFLTSQIKVGELQMQNSSLRMELQKNAALNKQQHARLTALQERLARMDSEQTQIAEKLQRRFSLLYQRIEAASHKAHNTSTESTACVPTAADKESCVVAASLSSSGTAASAGEDSSF
eukprot:gnl/Spiro4/13508_TR7201_c0_g1_i1.p1 gnl/Spiro4/13508_TR7201_c0_g1~~gnl/Spiro4/13508_TR7201_c0_g1_i1.p1  ORF type:complete len:216 (+),score=33.64 gnl/Spiro4/13508_TR7201_c0_g1_i1:773-1420(+)